MKSVKHCWVLMCALVILSVPILAQSTGGTSSASKPAASAPSGAGSASSSSSAKSKSSSSTSKLDINAATTDQLKALPGIDAATAQKIIAGRPYHAKNDLVNKKIISQSEYDTIKEQIIAHRAQGASSASGAKSAPAKQ